MNGLLTGEAIADPVIFGLFFLFFIFLGLVLGSFATAISYRIPLGKSWFAVRGESARSACMSCGKALQVRDLVPVFSWIFLRGKCRRCGAGIDTAYPVIELVALASVMLVFMIRGASVESFLIVSFVPFLLSLAVIDLKTCLLPNQLVAICAFLALALTAWNIAQSELTLATGFAYHLFSGLVYGGVAWAMGVVMSLLLRKEALGFGDVKFFVVAGIALGVSHLSSFLLLSGVFGLALGMIWRLIFRKEIFPFGPALITAFYLLLVFT